MNTNENTNASQTSKSLLSVKNLYLVKIDHENDLVQTQCLVVRAESAQDAIEKCHDTFYLADRHVTHFYYHENADVLNADDVSDFLDNQHTIEDNSDADQYHHFKFTVLNEKQPLSFLEVKKYLTMSNALKMLEEKRDTLEVDTLEFDKCKDSINRAKQKMKDEEERLVVPF